MRDPDGEEPDDFAAARGSARQGEVRWLHPAVSLRFVASQSHSTLSPHWEKVGTFNCLTALRVQVLLLPLGGFHI